VRVHIIEDDSAVSDALATVLDGLGYEVVCYPDGEGFLAAPTPTSEEVVIVDLGLPGIGGDQVVRHLNAQAHSPRVIVISGGSKTMLQNSLAGLSSQVVLRKPLSFPALAACLD
jgi:FixJ family two-component response regulator